MGKILEFRKKAEKVTETEYQELEQGTAKAIVDDFSLTPANRRWLLENLCMDVDEQLQEYRRELANAERTLEQKLNSSAHDVEVAYEEYVACLNQLTRSVKLLTKKLAH